MTIDMMKRRLRNIGHEVFTREHSEFVSVGLSPGKPNGWYQLHVMIRGYLLHINIVEEYPNKWNTYPFTDMNENLRAQREIGSATARECLEGCLAKLLIEFEPVEMTQFTVDSEFPDEAFAQYLEFRDIGQDAPIIPQYKDVWNAAIQAAADWLMETEGHDCNIPNLKCDEG